MSAIETTGRTVEDAITKAVMQLAVSRDNLEVEVIQEPVKPKLGLFGGQPAIIKAQPKKGILSIIEEETNKKEKKDQLVVKKSIKETIKKSPNIKDKKPEKRVNTKDVVKKTRNQSAIKDNEYAKKARVFLEGLFEKMDINVNIEIETNESSLLIDLSGENMGLLIGHRGETLDAIQYMISLIVNQDNEEFIRVVLDTENYREKREKTLEKLAQRLADKVIKTRRKVSLEPMNPYERRIIHAALQDNPKVITKSQGEEPYRKVVILMKRSNNRNNYKARRNYQTRSNTPKQSIKDEV